MGGGGGRGGEGRGGGGGGGGGGGVGPTVCYLFPTKQTCKKDFSHFCAHCTTILHSTKTYLNKSCTIFKHSPPHIISGP